jgi:hypothetical protein
MPVFMMRFNQWLKISMEKTKGWAVHQVRRKKSGGVRCMA